MVVTKCEHYGKLGEGCMGTVYYLCNFSVSLKLLKNKKFYQKKKKRTVIIKRVLRDDQPSNNMWTLGTDPNKSTVRGCFWEKKTQ